MKHRHRLPSGFGTIRYLGEGRKNAYAVHPPARGAQTSGRPKALCYVPDRETGMKVLALYHAGLYKPGMEEMIGLPGGMDNADLGVADERMDDHRRDDQATVMYRYCRRVLADIDRIKEGKRPLMDTFESHAFRNPDQSLPTFSEVYESFCAFKFGSYARKKLSKSARNAANSAFDKLAPFYDLTLDQVSVDALQAQINAVSDENFSKSTVSRVVTLIKRLYKYAGARDMCTKNYGYFVEMPSVKEEKHHQDFSDEELSVLWENRRDPVVQMVLVMCYSGFRVGEFAADNFETHLEGEIPYFRGGLKTAAGRDRIVPVHSLILPMVKEMNGVYLCGKSGSQFRRDMKEKMLELGIDSDGSRRAAGSGGHISESSGRISGSSGSGAKNGGRVVGSSGSGAKSSGRIAGSSGSGARNDGRVAGSSGEGAKNGGRVAGSSGNAARNDGRIAGSGGRGSGNAARYHTPHSCRHTFSRLCESYEVNEADRKRLMGHSFGNDITNGVYGHRSLRELKEQIEKLRAPEGAPKRAHEGTGEEQHKK